MVSVLHKNFIGMKSTPRLNTRDHDPRRADQCNLHTHVIANKNKSPVEKETEQKDKDGEREREQERETERESDRRASDFVAHRMLSVGPAGSVKIQTD